MNYTHIPSPCFVIDERALRQNLEVIKDVSVAANVDIIMALKAFATWGVFPIIAEYLPYTTASSVNEAQLGFEEMGTLTHSYAPIYTDENIGEFLKYSSHITFNSLAQFERFRSRVERFERKVSCGLRINPEYSEVDTGLYNPCSAGSRLGITHSMLGNKLPEGIDGLHFHTLCESNSYNLEKTLEVIEQKFGDLLEQISWINFGGGHLMTHKDYDTEHLVKVLKGFKDRHPHLKVILEPGSAFTWETGVLVSTIEDIVINGGINTAMLDVSFACHMPDCLEMPYKPAINGAVDTSETQPSYRMGGNSCLAGDFYGEWSFDHELMIGERIVFEDMIHYTMVKTTTFNGVAHPSIGLCTLDGEFKLIRKFDYEDFKTKLS